MSATTTEYQNKLEQWYGHCPGPVKTVLNVGNAYKTLDGWLKHIAGDPEKLVGYGPKYVELATRLESIAGEVTTATHSISGWEGESYEAFIKKTSDFSDKVSKTAKAIAGTQEILVACAKGCVSVANCIVDLVKMFVQWLIQTFFAALASSWCSFGATVAAWLGANIMKAIQLVGKVMKICDKLMALITKIVNLLKKIMEIVEKIRKIIAIIKGVFAAFKAFKNGDIMGGVTALSGAYSTYNSLSGGSTTSASGSTSSTLSSWVGTAGQVTGAYTSAQNGSYSGVANLVGQAVGSSGSGSLSSTLTNLWSGNTKAGLTDAANTYQAIQAARDAATRNSPT
jgi:hypothetical protein